MSWLFRKIGNALAAVKDYLIAYGALGLFGIALLDSAFVPMAGGPDAVMILLTAAHPSAMIFYAAAATAGSVIGCLILYYVSRRAGRRALARFSEDKQRRAKELLDRYDMLAVFVMAVLPPPFPLKVFIISAGVFRMNVWRFAAAIGAGRAIRFLLEGFVVARYGEQVKDALFRYSWWVGAVGVLLIVLLAAFFLARKFLKRKPAATAEQSLDAGD